MRRDDSWDAFLELTRFARAAVARFGSAGVDVEVAAYPDGRCRIVLPFAWARVYLETLQAQVAEYNEKLRRAAYQETIRRAEVRAARREEERRGEAKEPPGRRIDSVQRRTNRKKSAIPESPDRLMRLWDAAPAPQVGEPLSWTARHVLEVLNGVGFDHRGGWNDLDTEEILHYVESQTTYLTDYNLCRIPRDEILAAIEEVESWWQYVAAALRSKVGDPAGA